MRNTDTLQTLAFAVLFAASATLQGQTGNGSIQGTVKDESGAIMPGAVVTITRQETNEKFPTRTNGTGFFLSPSLVLGHYSVRVEAPGFQVWQAEVMLSAGQAAEINPTLRVGSSAQTVDVKGDVTPLVTTTSGTLQHVLEKARVDQLPLNGRDFTGLLVTVPGWEGNNSGITSFVYGLRFGGEIQMDGALIEERYRGNSFGRPPGLDSIGEMEATTNNASAKVARPGLVTLTTRSGANAMHGSLFETARTPAT